MLERLDEKNEMIMKLLHYFITQKNYSPIILQGVNNEIWLENMDSQYRIIRIVSNHIHNEEQFEYDVFKAKHIVGKIKRKTFTFNMNVLTIFTDINEDLKLTNFKNYDFIYLDTEKDLKKYDFVTEAFPDITKKLKFSEDGVSLYLKITGEIHKKNVADQEEAEEIFKPKKPIITYILIALNVIIFLYMMIGDNYSKMIEAFSVYKPYIVQRGQIYRLLTGAFLHANIFHLLFNCYALYVIGSQTESFMGKAKYLFIYLFSAISGSLLSITLNQAGVSIGASGAIFGLMGSLLYFGYHHRVYLGNVITSQIIPLIVLNLIVGFASGGQIDNFAHIGGLIGGILFTMALGVKYKSSRSEMINGWLISLIFITFLVLISFGIIV